MKRLDSDRATDGMATAAAATTAAAAAPLLEARGIGLRAGGRPLCAGGDVRLYAGECLVVLGPNGAGKTTLLHALTGLCPPAAGEVRLAGRPYAAWPQAEAARVRGLLTQRQPDHFSATVLEAVLIGRHPHLGRWQWESADDEACAYAALAEVGLAHLAMRDVLSLSGGERQRVAVAALLAQSPRLYLLDEPTNHLDLHYQIEVLELFARRAREGAAIAMVLHDINLAVRFADRVVLMDGRGGCLVAGTAAEVLQAERLSEVFGHPLQRHVLDGRVIFVPE